MKESAWGAGRGEPTIVTPKQYRQRFIGAMERYFPLVVCRLAGNGPLANGKYRCPTGG